MVVSVLDPAAYYADVTVKPSHSFSFPGMCFVELELGPLALDPENGQEETCRTHSCNTCGKP